MRWGDERYVKLYTRDTPDWLMLSWRAQGLFALLLRKCDGAGLIFLGRHGKPAVATLIGARWDRSMEAALDELLADGCVQITGSQLVIRNFIEAQEAAASDKVRKQHEREVARARAIKSAKELEAAVTSGHAASRGVTSGHELSHSEEKSLKEKREKKPCAEPLAAPAPASPQRSPAAGGGDTPAPKPEAPPPPPTDDSPVVAEMPCVKGQVYRVTAAKVAEWQDSFPGVDVLREVKAICQWARDTPSKRKTLRGAPGCFSRNLARKQDQSPNRRPNGQHSEADRELLAALERAEREAADPRFAPGDGRDGSGLRQPGEGDAAADPLASPSTRLSAAARALVVHRGPTRELQDAAHVEPGAGPRLAQAKGPVRVA